MRNYSLPRCEQFRELVLKMAAEGASLSAIGRAVGTGKRHVKAWLRRNGVTREFPIGSAGEKNPRWNGGRLVHPKGYILIYCPSHPHPNSGRYVFEHRLVVEAHLGRYLLPEEVVHHRNSVKDDNQPRNLQVFGSNGEHLAIELKGRKPQWTSEGLARMRQGVARSANLRRKRSVLTPLRPDGVRLL